MTRRDFSPPRERGFACRRRRPRTGTRRGGPQGADALVREVLLHLLDDGELGVEELERLLREVAELEARPEPHLARVGREDAGDHLEERRLARAVLPHHAPALAAADREVERVVDDAPAVAFVTPASVATSSPERGGLPEVELHDLARLRRLDPSRSSRAP